MDVNKDSKQQLMQAFGQIIAERKQFESKIATKLEVAEKAKNKQILEAASKYTVDTNYEFISKRPTKDELDN